jgi:hypothetical protein
VVLEGPLVLNCHHAADSSLDLHSSHVWEAAGQETADILLNKRSIAGVGRWASGLGQSAAPGAGQH